MFSIHAQKRSSIGLDQGLPLAHLEVKCRTRSVQSCVTLLAHCRKLRVECMHAMAEGFQQPFSSAQAAVQEAVKPLDSSVQKMVSELPGGNSGQSAIAMRYRHRNTEHDDVIMTLFVP